MNNKIENTLTIKGEMLEQFLLGIADEVIEMMQPTNSRIKNTYGKQTLVAGHLIVRGVPIAIVKKIVSEEFQMPSEIADDFVGILNQMITTVIITDSHGNRGRIAFKEQRNYSIEEDLLNMRRLQFNCTGLFMSHNYIDCIKAAEEALNVSLNAMMFQFLVISLQRLKRFADAEAHGKRALAALKYEDWHYAYMLITLDKIDVSQLYEATTNENERCQVRFYEGVRFLTLGKYFEAKLSLSECLRCSTNLFEKPLAQAELDLLETTSHKNEIDLAEKPSTKNQDESADVEHSTNNRETDLTKSPSKNRFTSWLEKLTRKD